ncbi:hypothetical protein BDV96DRAFT_606683 [Lophiotrema nucula]|uniref:Uncharacterized protein n=1 Tax=Lophiotrema nucula TaxID=690887 RepID=A0A6A5YMH8_9PLEO|nr:hypothetical protein BDV96DRAFT_606683 [Lophiotrema nucula]
MVINERVRVAISFKQRGCVQRSQSRLPWIYFSYYCILETAMMFAPIIHSAHNTTTTNVLKDLDHDSSAGWSTEAILALIGLVITIICIATKFAWPKLRRRSSQRRYSQDAEYGFLAPHHSMTQPPGPFSNGDFRQYREEYIALVVRRETML